MDGISLDADTEAADVHRSVGDFAPGSGRRHRGMRSSLLGQGQHDQITAVLALQVQEVVVVVLARAAAARARARLESDRSGRVKRRAPERVAGWAGDGEGVSSVRIWLVSSVQICQNRPSSEVSWITYTASAPDRPE
jgi:hypothetical protein